MSGPVMRFSSVVVLPPADNRQSLCRLYGRHVDGKKKNRKIKFFRNDPIAVINRENNRKIVLYAAGNGQVKVKSDEVGLDYNARDLLDVKQKDEREKANIVVRLATPWERFMFFWNHEDRATRFASRGTVQSVILGIIGVLLGALSVVLTVV